MFVPSALHHHPTIAIAVAAVFIVWRLYSRVRRLVARQPSRLWRHRATVLFFPTVLGLLALGSLNEPKSLLALASGIVVGSSLSIVALKLSRFEQTEDGPFYTPHAPIGIALSALFIARFVYRALELVEHRHPDHGGLLQVSATPITLLVFGTLASYYAGYAVGLLRWRRRLARESKVSAQGRVPAPPDQLA